MSKQSEAKEKQGYVEQSMNCATCRHYSSSEVKKEYKAFNGVQTWTEEKREKMQLRRFYR